MSETSHFRNWLQAVRSRRSDQLTAEILEGHMSSALCHLANIAYRLDRTIRFDGQSESFMDDAEANDLLTRPERTPFIASS